MYQGLYPVISNEEIMPGIHLVWVDSPEIASTAQPGQFAMVYSDNTFRRLLRRPISIHRVKTNAIAFLFAIVGEGTRWLAHRQRGDKVDVLGPMGNGFSFKRGSHHVLLVAGGMGIAPIVFLAQEALNKNKDVKLIAGGRNADQIYPVNLLTDSTDYIIITEDGTAGKRGLATDLLAEYAEEADQIFICGPLTMYKAISQDCFRFLKNKPTQVSLEIRMGCGSGFCFACTIRTKLGLKQVCKDGPVFNMKEVIWEELK